MDFEYVGANVVGTRHLNAKKNNQDSFVHLKANSHAYIFVVSDGCGSSPYSEVGSKILSRMVASTLHNMLIAENAGAYSPGSLLDAMEVRIQRRLSMLIEWMNPETIPLDQTVVDYFLATIVGAVILKDVAFIFSCGDGVYAVNDELTEIKPFSGNMPPFLAYSMLKGFSSEMYTFTLQRVMSPQSIDRLLIATDGLTPYFDKYTLDDLYAGRRFNNPDSLRRHFAVLNRESRVIDWDNQKTDVTRGLFEDDVSAILVRKVTDAADSNSDATLEEDPAGSG